MRMQLSIVIAIIFGSSFIDAGETQQLQSRVFVGRN